MTLVADNPGTRIRKEERFVICASTLGTVFEWYDFYLYGSMASIIGAQFFSQYPAGTRDIFALLAFAAGFLVRPFGSLIFGRIGDLAGRKYTFLITILIMGLSTFIVGFLPNADSIGIAAPIILVGLRLLQGLAVGGEYGGAATYVAEHSPPERRGFYTSFIQTAATLGLFLSLLVILCTRTMLGETEFASWGWRVPFLISLVLLGISVVIRLRLNESPVFKRMKEEGKVSKAPLTEAFLQWRNAKIALISLFGLTMGQAVIWYTGQFYSLFFLQSILKVDGYTTNLMIAWALLLGTAFFLVFGALSDKIGRKPIIMVGLLVGAVTLFPAFKLITTFANPALEKAYETVKVEVVADPASCGSLFNPVGTRVFKSPCDVARAFLASSSIRYTTSEAPAGGGSAVVVNGTILPYEGASSNPVVTQALYDAGYPKAGDAGVVKMAHPLDIFRPQVAAIIGLLFYLVFLVTMVYGPIAAALVEMFPTRIRYSSMSLTYNIGNGWFGGLLPATSFAIVAATGDIYAGLWYPVLFAGICFVVGVIFLRETKGSDID